MGRCSCSITDFFREHNKKKKNIVGPGSLVGQLRVQVKPGLKSNLDRYIVDLARAKARLSLIFIVYSNKV